MAFFMSALAKALRRCVVLVPRDTYLDQTPPSRIDEFKEATQFAPRTSPSSRVTAPSSSSSQALAAPPPSSSQALPVPSSSSSQALPAPPLSSSADLQQSSVAVASNRLHRAAGTNAFLSNSNNIFISTPQSPPRPRAVLDKVPLPRRTRKVTKTYADLADKYASASDSKEAHVPLLSLMGQDYPVYTHLYIYSFNVSTCLSMFADINVTWRPPIHIGVLLLPRIPILPLM